MIDDFVKEMKEKGNEVDFFRWKDKGHQFYRWDKEAYPEVIKELVNNKISEINKLKLEVLELQDKCSHKTVEVKNVSDGVVSLRKVCTTCGKIVGYPGHDDLIEAGY